MARREAPAFSRGNAAHKEQWLRHLARHLPRCCEGHKEDGPPRGLDKEYGWRSVGCLTMESEGERESAQQTPLIPA